MSTEWGFTATGERYFLARSLVAFRDSVDRQFPNRDKASDGWIGDAAHAARSSDHNPCWTCAVPYRGIVRAIDVDIDGGDPNRDLRTEILNSAIGHPAVWYVISNGKIYSRTYDWKANDYTGANGHFHHVHISINHDVSSYNDSSFILQALPKDENMITEAEWTRLGKLIYDENSAYAKAFWVATGGTGTAIRKDIAAIKAALDPATFAAAIAAKLPASAGIDEAAIESAVRAVFADAAVQ